MQISDVSSRMDAGDGRQRPAWTAHRRRHRTWLLRVAGERRVQRRAEAMVAQVYSRNLPPEVRAELVAIEAARFRETLRLLRPGSHILRGRRNLPDEGHSCRAAKTPAGDTWCAARPRTGKSSGGPYRCRRVR